ncbi:MAG TPA: hypothetical protein VF137_03050 [Candidatus Dormibacteraeota bacterium]
MPATGDSLAEKVSGITWYHQIQLPGGILTPGFVDAQRQLARLRLPESLAGKSVLDVGAWDGFYSFECARRGADRVLATDSYAWAGAEWEGGRTSNEGSFWHGQPSVSRVLSMTS